MISYVLPHRDRPASLARTLAALGSLRGHDHFAGGGVAIRRDAFLDLGGYDPSFGYYAEEYDLAARMLLAGFRIQFDRWFRVEHHKVWLNRSMDTILAHLVRNNGWVAQRYAPDEYRR